MEDLDAHFLDDIKHSILDEINIHKLAKHFVIKEQIPFGILILISYILN
jgi:hypothetical protein